VYQELSALHVSILIWGKGKSYCSVDRVKDFFEAWWASAQMDLGLFFVGVAEAAECGLVLNSLVGGDSAVSDVFVVEVEVVLPWGEEGVVVPRGDNA
jgi:hypothetical protein